MLTVETEVNVDSKNANYGGPFLVGSLDLSCKFKRFLFSLGFSSRTNKIFSLTICTLFQFLYPHRPAIWAGSRAGLPVS